MKILIFLAAVSAANIFVGVEGRNPIAAIGMSGHTEYIIIHPNLPGIEGFAVRVSINKSVTVGIDADLNAYVSMKKNGQWIYKSEGANLKPGYRIKFWAAVRIFGWDNPSPRPYTFIVPDAFPPTPTIGMCSDHTEYQVTLPNDPGIEGFAVHLNIMKVLRVDAIADFNIVVNYKLNGQWIYKSHSAKLRSGDTINYWTSVVYYGHEYRPATTLTFRVPQTNNESLVTPSHHKK